ncbi:hypothetical protein [Streptomyces sp. NPDC059639]|uniref:hypothetical protein n=1 Tax=Streptomyces sp. NPDC059639 TaxID=3346891 RepID=UPI00369ACC6A
MRALLPLALGDFRERARRPAYLAVLAASVGLAVVAVPARDAHWTVLQFGDWRGTYDSAYLGMVVALAGTVWLSLGGFYAVRGAVARDADSGVGGLLATTRLSTAAYLCAKFLSSLLVLASLLGVLALAALALLWARGESGTLDVVALLQPFVLIALPMVALTAAAALLFETIPLLRAGLGNVLWFFVWTVLVLGGQSPHAPLGGIGVADVVRSLGAALRAQGVDPHGAGEFSLGLTFVERPLRTFDWDGFEPTAAYVAQRLALAGIAVLVALVPAVWFARFDPARGHAPAQRQKQVAPAVVAPPAVFARPPVTPARTGRTGLRLLAGEARVLVRGTAWWWWAVTAALALLALCVTPATGVSRVLLPLSWIWPVLLWSRLGTQRGESGVDAFLAGYPRPARRRYAEWTAGVLLTAVAGAGAGLRAATCGDGPGCAAWACAVLFIPTLALALGTVSRTHRLFQAVYPPLWYLVVNGFAPLDFMGAIRDADGHPQGLSPTTLLLVTALLLGVIQAATARWPATLPGASPRGAKWLVRDRG